MEDCEASSRLEQLPAPTSSSELSRRRSSSVLLAVQAIGDTFFTAGGLLDPALRAFNYSVAIAGEWVVNPGALCEYAPPDWIISADEDEDKELEADASAAVSAKVGEDGHGRSSLSPELVKWFLDYTFGWVGLSWVASEGTPPPAGGRDAELLHATTEGPGLAAGHEEPTSQEAIHPRLEEEEEVEDVAKGPPPAAPASSTGGSKSPRRAAVTSGTVCPPCPAQKGASAADWQLEHCEPQVTAVEHEAVAEANDAAFALQIEHCEPRVDAGEHEATPEATAAPSSLQDALTRSNAEHSWPPRAGYVRIGGYDLLESRLPDGTMSCDDLDQRFARVREECKAFLEMSHQTAVRILLGCNLDVSIAVEKARSVAAWRRENEMDELRDRLLAELRGQTATPAVMRFPHHQEVCGMVLSNPLCLRTSDGRSVNVWHVSTVNKRGASAVKEDAIRTWSQHWNEYTDIWITQESERRVELLGCIHVFDLNGLNLWNAARFVACREKLKAVFCAAEHYVEAVSQVYVVNTSPFFRAAWTYIEAMLTPRCQSKFRVSSGIPEDLSTALGPKGAQHLVSLLQKPELQEVMRPDWTPA